MKSIHTRSLLVLLAGGIWLAMLPADRTVLAGTTIAVTTTNDELNSDGDCSLREAIQAANTDAAVDACPAGSGADVVNLPAGTYTLTVAGTGEDNNATGDLDINSNLTINGAGASTSIINGSAIDKVLHIGGGNVQINGVTITNGGNDFAGGGIGNYGGTLTINNTTVSGNNAPEGGGIYNGGTLTIINSTISGNDGGGGGGGISNWGTLTLTNSTITGNTASNGGGITAYQGTITISNTTISGNTAVFYGGGGIRVTSGTANIKNAIVAGNSTSGTGPDCSGTLTSQGYNLIQDTSGCTVGGDTTGNTTGLDPMLGPLQDNGGPAFTHALLSGSPAIDAGNPATPGGGGNACEATDQRGVARPQGIRCDIGAFEMVQAAPTPTPTATAVPPTPTATPVPPTPTLTPVPPTLPTPTATPASTPEPTPTSTPTQAPSRTLDSDETWSGEVHLAERIIVPEGIELTILPGTIVRVRTDSNDESRIGFVVYGSVVVIGTQSNRIEITGDNPRASTWQDHWDGFDISGRAVFQYCDISDGYDTLTLSGQVDSLHVSYCEFTNNHNFTIVFYNSNRLNSEISNNVFHNNHSAIGDIAGGYSGNQGNVLMIKRNLFYNNSNDAIRWSGRSEPTIINNTIISGYWAMLFSGLETSDAIVKNNIIYGQNYGIVLLRGAFEGVESEFPQILYNNFYNCSAGCYVADADPTYGYDLQPFAPSPGVGEISEDPLFVDYANADYQLSANSPSIDAGDPNSPYDPDGTIADMGAYYWTAPTPTPTPVPPTPTPTLVPGVSTIGMMVLAVLLMAAFLWARRRRLAD